jgi:hypothetical protein
MMPSDRPVVFLAFADAKTDLSAPKVGGWSFNHRFSELKHRVVIADLVVEEKSSLDRSYDACADNSES